MYNLNKPYKGISMLLFCKYFIVICSLLSSLYAQKINLLYDTKNDGTIYKNSIWIVEMIKEAGQQHNIEVNFEGVPWSRALELIKTAQADGLINASYKKERAKFAVYPMKNNQLDTPKSLKAPAYYLYKRKEHPLTFDGKQLFNAKGKIGAIKSYAVIDDLKKLDADIDFGTNCASNLHNVFYKKTIATAELEQEANAIIKNHSYMAKELIKLDIPVRKKEYYLIFSKPFYEKYPNIAQAIWKSIEELKNTPKYIKARHGLK